MIDYNIDEVAWYGESRHNGKTHPVGIKQANELGLHDMSGNLWEWTSDAYNGGPDRVFRGGSWLIDAEGCRVSYRFGNPGLSHYFVGFRLALDP